MTSLNATACRKPAAHDRPITRGVLRAAAAILAPLAQAYRTRRDTRHLLNLNDHLLNDLGITRRDIETVVRTGQVLR